MTIFSGAIWAMALQAGPSIPFAEPPSLQEKLLCILSIAGKDDQPGAPFTSINYYASGLLRIERELPESQAIRNTEDLMVQLDNVWFAQGRAEVNRVTSSDPMMDGAQVPVLQIPMANTFVFALSNARSMALWDNEGRREHYDLRNFDQEGISDWMACIATAPTPTASMPMGYRAQPVSQTVTPMNQSSWITADDYPSPLLRREVTGTVVYRLEVSVNGRVRNCSMNNDVPANGAIVNNVPELNDATCRLIKRRARFSPATDASGRPFISNVAGQIRWTLP